MGLGGLDDCTNIINPEVSVITSIGYDHIDILGNTIEEIAIQKAGIIKKDSNTVALNQKNVIDIIKKKCEEENNKVHIVDEKNITGYSFDKDIQKFTYEEYKDIEINLKGKVQTVNCIEVLECIDILKDNGFNISEDAIRRGLKNVVHKARMEVLNESPLIVFDGGHNDGAINNLKANIDQYYNDKRKVYIVSILSTKDFKTIIKNLCQDKEGIYFFTNGVKDKKYVSNKDLYNEASKYLDKDKLYKEELDKAISIAKKEYKDHNIFIVRKFLCI